MYFNKDDVIPNYKPRNMDPSCEQQYNGSFSMDLRVGNPRTFILGLRLLLPLFSSPQSPSPLSLPLILSRRNHQTNAVHTEPIERGTCKQRQGLHSQTTDQNKCTSPNTSSEPWASTRLELEQREGARRRILKRMP